jgi:hypothetical protein
MSKTQVMDEVHVLRFFEDSSLEKAETVFNIVSQKMRDRLNGRTQDEERPSPKRKRRPSTSLPAEGGTRDENSSSM